MTKKIFEVAVEYTGTRFYEVRANTAEEARELWGIGDFVGEDFEPTVVIAVTEAFEDDDYDGD